MANIGFPLFDLKSTNDYLFLAGGGGSKEYGKENGIMAMKKVNLVHNVSKVDHFYKTSDFILHLQIYTERKDEILNLYPEISLEDAPAMADGFDSTESELVIPFNKDLSSSEEIIMEERQSEGVEQANAIRSRSDKKIHERKPSNAMFILAIGDNFVYILKFTNSFTLHCKIEKRVNYAFLNKHLFILKDNRIKAFFDTIKNPSALHFKTKKIEENVSDPTEEYVYCLYKKESAVIPLNEHFTRDIPKDWDGFFIFGSKIHKIKKEGNSNVFVFKNQKYEINGKISRIVVQKDTLVFYSNTEKEGNLYFISNEAKVYKLPRITAFDVVNNTTTVATIQGNAIIYRDGCYLQRMNISNTPVTGIVIDKSNIYFTQLDGVLRWVRRVSNFEKCIKVASIILLLIAIICYFVLKVVK